MERALELTQEKLLKGPLLLLFIFCNVLDFKNFSRLKVIVPKTN